LRGGGVGVHPAILRPQERPQVERRAGRELRDALADDRLDLAGVERRAQPERGGRTKGTLTMEVEVGRHALEAAGAVKDRGPQPHGVVPHLHDQRIAVDPFAVDIVKCLHDPCRGWTTALAGRASLLDNGPQYQAVAASQPCEPPPAARAPPPARPLPRESVRYISSPAAPTVSRA